MNSAENLTQAVFKDLCPVLIYQLDTDACHSHHTNGHIRIPVKDNDHDYPEHSSPEKHEHDHDHEHSENKGLSSSLSNSPANGRMLCFNPWLVFSADQ